MMNVCGLIAITLKSFLGMFVLEPQSSYKTMPKKGKKKAKTMGDESDIEIYP